MIRYKASTEKRAQVDDDQRASARVEAESSRLQSRPSAIDSGLALTGRRSRGEKKRERETIELDEDRPS